MARWAPRTRSTTDSPVPVLLAPGPESVYYRRTVVPTDGHGGFGPCSSIDRAAVRVGYLASLGNMPPAAAERLFHRETVIHYRDVDSFKSEVEKTLQAQTGGIRQLIQSVQERHRLSPSGAVLKIQLEVIDGRHAPTDSLPDIAPREIGW